MDIKHTDDDLMYHYCSMDSFVKIIESNTIRLGNVVQMNDPTESKLRTFDWCDLIYKRYLKDPFEFNFLCNGKNYNFKDYLDILSLQVAALKSESYFALCMTSKRDDLNQWRVYGDDGKGVCLGFDTNDILEFDDTGNFYCCELEYVDLDKIAGDIAESLLWKIRDCYLRDNDEYLQQFINNFYSDLESFIIGYKHIAYESEAEFRLIYKHINLSNKHFNSNRKDEIITTYENGLLKSYKEIKLSELRIANITFGPNNEVPIENIKLFLSKHNIDLNINNIFYSTIPYRKNK